MVYQLSCQLFPFYFMFFKELCRTPVRRRLVIREIYAKIPTFNQIINTIEYGLLRLHLESTNTNVQLTHHNIILVDYLTIKVHQYCG